MVDFCVSVKEIWNGLQVRCKRLPRGNVDAGLAVTVTG